MLTEISNLITPEVYEVIYRMGHMDEWVIADANYPASALSRKVVFSHAPVNHLLLAETLRQCHAAGPRLFARSRDLEGLRGVLEQMSYSRTIVLNRIGRTAFYRRTRHGYATVQTSDPRPNADIIIRKEVV